MHYQKSGAGYNHPCLPLVGRLMQFMLLTKL
jgi:hypothetical protein